jgi:hypothetical protein
MAGSYHFTVNFAYPLSHSDSSGNTYQIGVPGTGVFSAGAGWPQRQNISIAEVPIHA